MVHSGDPNVERQDLDFGTYERHLHDPDHTHDFSD
jgi:hypothetical protein